MPNTPMFKVMIHQTTGGVTSIEIPARDATEAMSQVLENERYWPYMVAAYKIDSKERAVGESERSISRWR